VEKDVQSICTSGIADSVIFDKVIKLTLRLNSKLPCYCFTSKPSKKTFSPFIEVSVKDGTFAIRKITAIYYKKMSEFHQTGCLVLGRSNHIPAHHYHLPQSFTAPSVSEKAHIGDLCVFQVWS